LGFEKGGPPRRSIPSSARAVAKWSVGAVLGAGGTWLGLGLGFWLGLGLGLGLGSARAAPG